ncbi:MAG: NADH:flavin oxidoreductase/NADH oxidase [Deltaproteobacteria bacterium]|nr:NADH:flavin oxidoreductase/NADH oxidase [Deltaproteobacteria bacterium]
MAEKYPRLFSPLTLHTMTLKNRVVMPPMCTDYATIGGAVTDRLIEYYTTRARGGVGLIDVEFAYVHPAGKVFEHMLGIYDDKLIPGLRRLTDSVHQGGAKIIIQIAHGGRRGHSDITGLTPVAPSPIPRLNGETPKELSLPEIEDLIQAFILAAARARKAGFDGVMIHMAHAYLLQQFLSPFSNARTDRYGGDLEGRARFPLEIVKGVRRELGDDYPVTCRLCGDEFLKGGFDLAQSIQVAKMLEANGVNAIEVSAGAHETGQVITAPPYYPMGFLSPLSEGIKKAVGIPVGIVGRIHTPDTAEQLLEQGKADLIAVGRGLIADPEWPKKAQEGRPETIRPCISCNQGCSDRMYFQKDISCTVNPAVGREGTFPMEPARRRKKVLILGGGPGGLEAALVAAKRGHTVQLYEKKEELGGQLNIASVPPAKEKIREFKEFLIREIKGLPIKVVHGKLDAKTLRKISPDLLVVAVGGKPKAIEGPGFEDRKVVSAWEVLSGERTVGKRVVIIGGGQVGLETAHFLLGEEKEITVLEMLKRTGEDMSPRARKLILEKLIQGGVEILTESKALSIEKGDLVFDRAGLVEKMKGMDSIIIAVGTDSQDEEIPGLGKSRIPLRRIGDAAAPRKLFDAIHEGYQAGIEI